MNVNDPSTIPHSVYKGRNCTYANFVLFFKYTQHKYHLHRAILLRGLNTLYARQISQNNSIFYVGLNITLSVLNCSYRGGPITAIQHWSIYCVTGKTRTSVSRNPAVLDWLPIDSKKRVDRLPWTLWKYGWYQCVYK